MNQQKKIGNKEEVLDTVIAEKILDKSIGAEENYVQQERVQQISNEIDLLPEPYREVFLLRIYGELFFREIGEQFGKTEIWGRVTFLRAREKVVRRLQNEL